jgi:hypothetical protein
MRGKKKRERDSNVDMFYYKYKDLYLTYISLPAKKKKKKMTKSLFW